MHPTNNDQESEEEPTPTPKFATPARKAKKMLGLCKDIPLQNGRPRITPSWQQSTLGSLRRSRHLQRDPSRSLGRMSSRDSSASNPSTSAGESSLSSRRRTSHVGPSKLRASFNVTPASDQTSENNFVSRSTQTSADWVRTSVSPARDENKSIQPPVQVGPETKSRASLRVKAKKSIRNLFVKSDTKPTSASKLPQPISKPTDPNRAKSTEPRHSKSTEPKRASIASSGKTLVKRISRRFSDAHLSFKTPDIPEIEMQNLVALKKRDAALAALEAAAPVELTLPKDSAVSAETATSIEGAAPAETVTPTEVISPAEDTALVDAITSTRVTSAAEAANTPTALYLETADTAGNLVRGINKSTIPSPNTLRRLDLADVRTPLITLHHTSLNYI